MKEYNQIEQIFKAHHIPYSEEKLKAAIVWNNRIHPDKEKAVDYTAGRYPAGMAGALMINPFKEDKKKGKKKKKKWTFEKISTPLWYINDTISELVVIINEID